MADRLSRRHNGVISKTSEILRAALHRELTQDRPSRGKGNMVIASWINHFHLKLNQQVRGVLRKSKTPAVPAQPSEYSSSRPTLASL
jgi:hypothetical protein